MHELSVCRALLDRALAVAATHEAASIGRLVVRIGPLSGVEPGLLREAFAIARTGTAAARAELVVQRSAVRVRCERCGAESECPPNRLICSHCGDASTQLTGGDELLLVSVELLAPAGDEAIAR
ncbi:hydrogenase maturation nickel metallochaperone HypA/HybF [Acidihalobacter prosperus]|uniref:Hydrogenase maturation factor HypA n=1 Tax=Acidihalobacter prosperus TaxID=160660 RepID=A0A1A6C2P5_9GAMM|nr:hydrogenase maturation nickel metallochaperone HypA [Acidihalobacter prosperus]OBS08824.1 [NiFe] hydrogenase nickel incorporation protein HypA [Acidihalobacter prosperus]